MKQNKNLTELRFLSLSLILFLSFPFPSIESHHHIDWFLFPSLKNCSATPEAGSLVALALVWNFTQGKSFPQKIDASFSFLFFSCFFFFFWRDLWPFFFFLFFFLQDRWCEIFKPWWTWDDSERNSGARITSYCQIHGRPVPLSRWGRNLQIQDHDGRIWECWEDHHPGLPLPSSGLPLEQRRRIN